ncbi:Cohesin domain-containing protein [Desulfonema limicola]|uniref:Cohesin domain-containing protein n=1 Tax=Desulfonema limicola TaxID=45656 RepID=A0A975GI67_9BACT|nr:cohesin domain-containing protein [Desulfonema limicola]QTA82227.1 Cohesin domain-containing protein [Desulfonema limicola]
MKKFCYILFLFYALFIISSSALAAVVKIDPESVNINNVGVGNTFNVNIAIENVTNLGGFEFELQYDNAVITIENDSDVSIGAFLSSSGRSVSLLKNTDTAGLLKAGAFSYGDPIGPDGNGVLIQVTFKVQSLAEGALDLKNVILTDTSAASIAVDTTTDAAVTAIAETLTVQVMPASVTLNNIGNTFDADIMIQGVKNLGSFEFKLQYNPAVVKIANDTDVTLGTFLESTGRTATRLGPNIDNDAGLLEAGAFSFGDQAGPNGSGVLMKIKFTIQSLSAGQLDLKDVLITDISAVSITVDTVKDGNLYIPPDDPIDDTTDDTTYYADKDGDGTPDYLDKCPDDPSKVSPGSCGCGVADTDTDSDGTPDCNDKCSKDPDKVSPGSCGCGVAETDTDNDGTPDCNDKCPKDPAKTEEGTCGCGVADTDTDGDGIPDCNDPCVDDPDNACNGPGLPNDTDGDGVLDSEDGCPNDPNKTQEGTCGCGIADTDTDNDGTLDCNDKCPKDPAKTEEGTCGCGIADTDTDNDGTPDCNDKCPKDPAKTEEGDCGCGIADTDTDNDGTPDCSDPCPDDPENKCDSDNDGISDDKDACPDDPDKTEPGICGCGVADIDSDGDGIFDCNEDDSSSSNCFINTAAHSSMGMLSGIFSFLAVCIGISVRKDRISKK